jgi:hypothetical protein
VSGTQVAAPRALGTLANPESVLPSVAYGGEALVRVFGLPVLVLISVLSLVCLRRDWRLTIVLLAPTVVVTPFIAHFAAESDPLRYYIVPTWGLIVAAALGIRYSLAGVSLSRGAGSAIVCGVAAVLIAHNLYSGRSLFVQRFDRLGYAYIDDVDSGTSDGSVIVAQWNYATPIAYAAYVQGRMGSRTLVAGDASDFASYYRQWLGRGRIYVVAEEAPVLPAFNAIYLRNFDVIPGSRRDPKLYELQPRVRTGASRSKT